MSGPVLPSPLFRRRILSCAALAALLLSGGCAPRATPSERATKHPTPDLTRDARATWLRQHAEPSRTIDPADDDFSDLEPLRHTIGDARIVMLGEQTHLDGATYLAISRVIRFLHQEMGFDVLVREQGMYGGARIWEALRAGSDPLDAFAFGWALINLRVAEQRTLMEYIARMADSERPLEVAGFDINPNGTAPRGTLVIDLRTLLGRLGVAVTSVDEPSLYDFLQNVISGAYLREEDPAPRPGPVEIDLLFTALGALQQEVEQHAMATRDRETAFWSQVLLQLEARAKNQFGRGHAWTGGPFDMNRNERNGETILWMANQYYSERKLIVWAATFHTMRNAHQVRPDPSCPPRAFCEEPGVTSPTYGPEVSW
jgi:erythromycin esterase